MTPFRRPVARTALVALLAAACGRQERASVPYDGPFADQVRRSMAQIERGTGLRFVRSPVLEERTPEEVRGFLEQEFSTSAQAKDLDRQAAAYRLLGLLPDSVDLRTLYLDLLGEQVVGYYDPKVKKLFVVRGQPADMVGITVAHELVHALQDQHFNLDSLATAGLPNDRLMAAQAAIEGMAVHEQFSAMIGEGNVAARLPGGWDMVRQQIRENSASMPRFSAAPFLVQEDLLFPYLSGAQFVREFKAKRAGAAPLATMPASTEQVLHPDKLLGAAVDAPLAVALPAPRRGTVSFRSGLGEFETRLFLYQHLQDQPTAVRGAAGWGGDALQVVRFPTGEGLVWLTVWDSAVDAGEFYQLADRSVIARFRPRTYRPLGQNGKLYPDVRGRAIRVEAVTVGGRPAVLYVDVPSGGDTDLVDVAKASVTGG